MVFVSIGYLINREVLKKCHEEIDKDKAAGIDGVTKQRDAERISTGTSKNIVSIHDS